MKDTGRIISSMVKVMKSFRTELLILEPIATENQKDMALTLGKMDKLIKDSGLMARSMAQAFGGVQMETLTSVNGNQGRQMATVCTLGLMEIDMKANFKTALNMVRESNILRMAIHTKECTKMVNLRVMGNTIGQWEVFSKETSRTVFEMGREYGSVHLETVINMKESIRMIKSKALEFLYGKMVIFTKEPLSMISKRAMGNCCFQMDRFGRGDGSKESKLKVTTISKRIKRKISIMVVKKNIALLSKEEIFHKDAADRKSLEKIFGDQNDLIRFWN